MKKIISIVIMLFMVCAIFAGCAEDQSNETASEKFGETAAMTDNADTETQGSQRYESESATETETAETNNSTNQQKTEETKQDNSKITQETSVPPTTTKPATDSSSNNGNTTTPPNNDNKQGGTQNQSGQQNTKTEEKTEPYLVRIEYVSETHPTTSRLIDGQNFFTRFFGPQKAMQVGDSYTYRIVMSDGGSKGFKYVEPYGGSHFECSINGNLMTFKAKSRNLDAWRMSETFGAIEAKDKNGNTVTTRIGDVEVYQDTFDLASDDGTMFSLVFEYAKNRGIALCDGPEITNKEPDENYIPIKHSTSGEWISKVLKLIEEFQKKGYTKWAFQIHQTDGFSCIAE